MINPLYIPWMALAGSIVFGSCAQVALKLNANRPPPPIGASRLAPSPWLLLWAGGFVIATLLWIIALKHLDLSYAYPLLGLGYVIVTALAAVFLKEHVSRLHWLSVLLIAIGAACIARSI